GAEVVKSFPDPSLLRCAVINDEDRKKLPAEMDCAAFDFQNPDTFANAFRDVRAMYLMRPPHLANVDRDFVPAIHAAVAAGVEHFVFLSIVGVENATFVPHYKIEQAVKASGAAYTFLRCSFFMQNLNTTHRPEIRDDSEIRLPVGKAKTSFIDVRDIGAVAATVLSAPTREKTALTLTGAESLDYYQVADILTDVLGRKITYTHPDPVSFAIRQKSSGRPWGMTLVMTMLYVMTRNGSADVITDDVQRVLGRTPISFRQYAEDTKAAWMPANDAS
ncbi:MAG TPA: NmrA family NAD(P)-binding protein, partial [Candidatus Limnocylindrales bacterium]|nr:NmrA family NAD(P)-binding protein [Candidatus Limnocylindrales bacterium]